ncbi:MAG: thioesterase domain-containing protein [candidate division KSB1 bacterium]|nr:thioesterase domain-containing protein [candidate division KSB1 bacterium]MDZ7276581.1 thioesterase domain-containing protein [candidate division KSB1 bacterium]MDZ7288246.1 thioesterase domain-containing protein [candidate division KSB1 bacterium]MDZ7300363.1 thioesterase domain-containing protein [candidate division KSB1 bacterium]MDZ7309246.1 thioesterase domain-containing protein [candidate division KSB1 bacterium]
MLAGNPSASWVVRPRPNPRAALRLFCFPYAGAGSIIFRSWPEQLPVSVETCLVELPGRGSRLREPLFTRLLPMIDAALPALLPYLDRPFAFFGHSMGALLSFELTRRLRRQADRLPSHLFVSGRAAPHLPDAMPALHKLPEAEFIAELRRLNGTPGEVLEHAELMQLLMPILRADFAVCETYVCEPGPPLACPITVFGGAEDPHVTRATLEPWREHTSAGFALHILPGDHFFLQSAAPMLLQIMREELLRLTGQAPGR